MKYDIEKNKKFLKSMEPTEVDKVLLWLFTFVGLYAYCNQWDDALLGFLSFGIMYKGMSVILWLIHCIIHAIICKKRGVNLDE